MMRERSLQIGMLCYPRLTQLDLTGPYEVLSRMRDSEVHILWKDTAPVKTEKGFCIVPTLRLRESPNLDVLVVPGGLGQQPICRSRMDLPAALDLPCLLYRAKKFL
jgi:cyclohexyl-isocyanide hydratase